MTQVKREYKWLPIGSIVKLKNIKKAVMVYGRDQIQKKKKKNFDYVSVPYPEGNITEEFNLFFNHNMIEEVLFEGFINDEEIMMQKKLNKKRKKPSDADEV